MIKYILTGLALCVMTLSIQAQGWGVYAGAHAHYGELNEDGYGFFGGKVAFIADNDFAIGFGAYGFGALEKLGLEDDLDGLPKLAGGYVGLHLEPIIGGGGSTSISFPVMLGWGKAGLQDRKITDDFDIDFDTRDWSKMYVVEPGININFHMSRFFQMDIGARYRFSTKINIPNLADERINGWSAGVEFKFGLFPRRYNRWNYNNNNNNNNGRRGRWRD